jgi:hypothetical protein
MADCALPEWVIDRAAAYMMRRYGQAALKRADSRHRFLREQGQDQAADHWMKVAETIATIARRRAQPARGR